MKTCHLFSRNFDAHRVTAYNIDPALLQTFTSPKELETLSYQDVLKIGDDLATIESRTYANPEGKADIVKTATILSLNVNAHDNRAIWVQLLASMSHHPHYSAPPNLPQAHSSQRR